MDRNTAKELNATLKTLLEQFAADHNLELSTSGGNYTDASFSPKITFTEKAADGSKKISDYLAAKINWELLSMGCPELKAQDVMGKKFTISTGITVTITDYQVKGKYHWIARKADGSSVRCPSPAMLKFAHPVAA